jgi:hypothetical protein
LTRIVRYKFFGLALVAALFVVGALTGLHSCKKWTDPKGYTDPRLTNPYCNDPSAVNYNWGFPGKPDNTVCFYPTDEFKGRYLFIDSVYSMSGATDGNFLYAIIDTLHIYARSDTTMVIYGFCNPADSMRLHARGLTFTATVDTTVGDSLTTTMGQLFCRVVDTVNGTIFFSRVDSMLHINFTITSDTGLSAHVGKGKPI